MANNRFTPERKNTERSEKTAATELRTQSELLSGVRGQREAEERHAGDENTGDDEVEEVVESSPPDVDGEGDVHIGLRAAVVRHAVLLPGHPWSAGEM